MSGDHTKLNNRVVGDDAIPSKSRCKRCGWRPTHAEVMKQFGRLMKAGLTREEAKIVLPRCSKCTTRFLKERAEGQPP